LELKLSNFFEKVSSPVMTDMDIEWGSMKVFDIFPRKLPDLFRGSQQTVLGRYSGPAGSFPLTLKGKIRNESHSLKYDKNEFPNISTSNDFLPRIWAMRKVGYLLDEIRTSGDNEESKKQIIKLAKKYGFVTPYTSYLAADEKVQQIAGGAPRPPAAPGRIASSSFSLPIDVPIGDISAPPSKSGSAGRGSGGGIGSGAGIGSGIGSGMSGFSGGRGGGGKNTPSSASGTANTMRSSAKAAVESSVELKKMKSAEIAAPQSTATTKWVGSKEFSMKGEVWTDTAYSPDKKLEVVDLVFGSEAMIKAISSDKQLAAYAALGKKVTVVHNGKVYRIHP
jgi:Ca-activated chloride channel homolog